MKTLLVVLLVCVASTIAQENKKPQLPDLGLDVSKLLEPVQKHAADAVSKFLTELLGQLKGKIDQFGNGAVGKRDLDLKRKFETVKLLIEVYRDFLVKKVTEVYDEYAEKLKQAYPKLLVNFHEGKRDVENAEKSATDKLIDIASESTKHIQNLLANLLSGAFGKLVDAVNVAVGKRDVEGTTNAFKDSVKQFLDTFNGHLVEILKTVGKQGIDKLKGLIPSGSSQKRDVVKGVKDAVNQLVQTLQGHLNNVSKALVDHGKDVLSNLQPHFDNLKDQLKSHGVNAAQSVLDALAQASSTLVQG